MDAKNFSVLIKNLDAGRADLVLFVFKLIFGYQEYNDEHFGILPTYIQ